MFMKPTKPEKADDTPRDVSASDSDPSSQVSNTAPIPQPAPYHKWNRHLRITMLITGGGPVTSDQEWRRNRAVQCMSRVGHITWSSEIPSPRYSTQTLL